MRLTLLVLFSIFYISAVCMTAAQDIVIADFEGKDYGNWKVEGAAFGTAPAQGALPNQAVVNGYRGKGLANSFHGCDGSTGTLTSPPFVIERPFINFLIGGGVHPGKTCINLIINKKVVRSSSGLDNLGGAEALCWSSWDVRKLNGKTAVIQIVDKETGGWGHINVDQIFQSERDATIKGQQEVLLKGRYLNFPVKTGAVQKKMSVIVDGCAIRQFEIELADSDPDFWVFTDVGAWKGKTATVKVSAMPEESAGLKLIECSDTIKGSEGIYREKFRPKFHYTASRGWLNDTNGLAYYKGEYHLMYQHNPYGVGWLNLHWGHAVSSDLVHWRELPEALHQYTMAKGQCFSGSATVDEENTAGYQIGREKALVALFTDTGCGESLVYSIDRGRTWNYPTINPIMQHGGRDPKVFWYKPGKHWVMAVYEYHDGKDGVAFYTSSNLKNWQRQSWVGDFFECPDMYPIAVEGNPGQVKWVLSGGDGSYAIGSFDGKKFTPETGKIRYIYGNCYYAGQTFNNIPELDGRRIQIAWGHYSFMPDMPFSQCMLFPVSLTLHSTDEGLRLYPYPVKEIDYLHGQRYTYQNIQLGENASTINGVDCRYTDIQAECSVGKASKVTFNVRGVPIVYDAVNQTLSCNGCSGPLKLKNGKITLRILMDCVTLEIFGNEGELYMPNSLMFDESNKSLTVSGDSKGVATIDKLDVYEMRSMWE